MTNSQPTKVHKYYSQEIKSLFQSIADALEELPVTEISVEYFLLSALGIEDTMLYKALNGFLNSITIEGIYDDIYKIISTHFITVLKPGRKIPFSDGLNKILNEANNERIKYNRDTITSDCILLAVLASDEYQNTKSIFQRRNIDYNKFLELSSSLYQTLGDVSQITELPNSAIQVQIIGNGNNNQLNDITKMIGNAINGNKQQIQETKDGSINYCTNLNLLSEKGEIDDLVGRDDIIEQITRVLSRRKSNNVVLVGESGVGKTALVEGLAKRIRQGVGPNILKDKNILRFNVGDMMGGTQFRGIFEDRMNNLMKSLKKKKNNILFIDNFHNFLKDKQNNEFDIPTFMSTILNDGDVNVIATTTYKGYRNGFANNSEINRHFQKIDVEPLSVKETIDVLQENKVYYTGFHKVIYTDEALETCAKLSKRYLSERYLPASAIDILDEAGAAKKIECFGDNVEIKQQKETLMLLKKDKDEAIKNDNIDKAKSIDNEINTTKLLIAELEEKHNNVIKNNVVDVNDIYKAISLHTNIPVGKLNTSEKQTVSNIDSILKNTIVGQDEAINAVANAIKRSKVGLYPPNKPIFSCICIGNTGCGKTLLAKSLAKEIFGDEKYLIRFDMSEYSDKTSVNKLIGSSAGYIGYDRGGLLTEAVKNKKHVVLLIDEIEKSTDEVFNLFLQIFDEGFLTDNTGQKVDFKNTIIILTSNVGVKKASTDGRAFGFNPDNNINKKEIIEKELKKKFPPEFINRLDDIIYFNNLTDDNLKDIIKLELEKLRKRLQNLSLDLNYDDNVVGFIFEKMSKEKEYGARPILRIIQNDIENQIADLLLENDYDNYTINCTIDNNKLVIM